MKVMNVLCAMLCFGVAYGAYPTSYPFENESYTPPGVVPGTPSYTWDDEDTGGYIYQFIYNLQLTDEYFQQRFDENEDLFCWTKSGSGEYLLVVQFKHAPFNAMGQHWNCTFKNNLFIPEDFTGVIAGKTICEAGSCCQDRIGHFRFGSVEGFTERTDKLAVTGLCGDMFEDLYCGLVDGHSTINCQEYVCSSGTCMVTDRLYTALCHDSAVLWALSCPTFKAAGMTFGFNMEPPLYMEKLTAVDQIVLHVMEYFPDKVCKPYSYFFPDTAATSNTDTETSETTDGSSETTTSGTSTAVKTVEALFFGLFSFFSLV